MIRVYANRDAAEGRFDPSKMTGTNEMPPRVGMPPVAVRPDKEEGE